MKSFFQAVATVAFSSTIAFSAMALTPSTAPMAGLSPLGYVGEESGGGCTELPDGSTKCCEPCGEGVKCCVTIGPIQGN